MANQSEVKYNRLMEKAQELFWKYGYNGVSVDQIANEAGISKMTLYKHFATKEDLLMEVLRIHTTYHMNIIMDKLKEDSHSFDKIEWLYNYTVKISKDFPDILIKDIMDRVNIVEKLTAFKQEKALVMWQYILKDGIQKGEIRPLDIEFASNLLLYLPTFLMKLDFYEDEHMMVKMLENLFDFMKYGLLGNKEICQIYKDKVGSIDAEKHSDSSGECKQKL